MALDAGGSAVDGAVFTWSSSDDSAASVDERGLVRALSAGTAVITAAHGTATGTATIVVSRPEPLTDRDVLEALYHAAGGTDWANAGGWLSEAPLGRWHGIETDGSGSVTAVRLPGNSLVGGIPPELGHLPYLETLILRENNLTGPLPPEIGLAIRLRELDLGHTELEGPIPATLGRLADLRRLNFEYVPFSGSIPPELGALEELEFLNLVPEPPDRSPAPGARRSSQSPNDVRRRQQVDRFGSVDVRGSDGASGLLLGIQRRAVRSGNAGFRDVARRRKGRARAALQRTGRGHSRTPVPPHRRSGLDELRGLAGGRGRGVVARGRGRIRSGA